MGNPQKFERSIISSVGAIIDKLEGKYGAIKLYSTRFEHPSIKGMQLRKKKKSVKAPKAKTNILQTNKNQENIKQQKSQLVKRTPPINAPKAQLQQQIQQKKQIQIPRATSRELPALKAKANTIPIPIANENPSPQTMPKQQTYQPEIGRNDRYESKQHEIEINNVQTAHYNVNQQQQQVQQREEKQMDAMEDEDDIAMEESRCDLAAYNVQLRKYKNETVKFHFKMQQENNMSMTQRYEQMQIKETEKSEKINEMKKE